MLVMSLTHIAVSNLLWVFNTLPPLSSLDFGHSELLLIISQVSAIEGSPLSGIPLYI